MEKEASLKELRERFKKEEEEESKRAIDDKESRIK